MSAALQILARAQDHGLPAEAVAQVQRELVPLLDIFLGAAPSSPPPASSTHERDLHRRFVDLLVAARQIRVAWQPLLDAFGRAVEDLRLRAEGTDDSAAKRRALANLADALDSVTRINVAIGQARPDLVTNARIDLDDVDDDARGVLRGGVAMLLALLHIDGEASTFAAWTWTARVELVKAEGLTLAQLARPERAPPRREIPRRVPGAWKGLFEIADDFDAPLPSDVEGLFHGGDDGRSGPSTP